MVKPWIMACEGDWLSLCDLKPLLQLLWHVLGDEVKLKYNI